MGIILGKFRKKKSTYELLEKLDSDIRDIEEYRLNTERAHKKVGRFILTSVGLYVIFTIGLYFYSFPKSWRQHLHYALLVTLIPILIYITKFSLAWWYNRKIMKNRSKVISLRAEKKKLLEKVMETETYKVARDLLDKFAPDQLNKTNALAGDSTPIKQIVPVSKAITNTGGGSQLRLRTSIGGSGIPPAQTLSQSFTGTPYPQRPLPPHMTPNASSTSQLASALNGQRMTPALAGGPTPLPLPRTILSRDRSVIEKMVEYLVGDGPSNRFALICKHCNSHNGMALKEEFEYIAFRCCYCYNMNPARKQRPTAPKLEFDTPEMLMMKFESSDDSEKHDSMASSSDSESDVPPVVSDETVEGEHVRNENANESNDSDVAEDKFQGKGDGNDANDRESKKSQSTTNYDVEDASSVKTEQSL